jgi:MoaA/NifB/PqqE/SkfB family radical SAM enzyme
MTQSILQDLFVTAFSFEQIKEYQIEITSYCNAACPQCPRNINGGSVNTYMPLQHLSREIIDQTFDSALCQRLQQIFFCGSYGDPIMHPDFLNILADFRSKNPQLWLYVHTNGGVHDTAYWSEIAKIMRGHGQIDFGIDGLGDTLSLYRRNVIFDRVIENAQAFINAGGRAQWNFIVFRHNQHQVEQARQLSKDLKFANFLPRRTGRFFHHGTEQELDRWPVRNRQGDVEYFLEPPDQLEWRNPSTARLPLLKREYQDLSDYFDTTPIRCDALAGRKVAVNAQGLVLPCNFFNHNLYDARFYEDVLPGANRLHSINGKNQVRAFLESYGLDNLNINHRSLSEIFQCKMWDDLVRSWNSNRSQGRLFECAMTCGEKFTKVWDQGSNNT